MDIDPTKPNEYAQASALASAVVEAYVAGKQDCLSRLFNALEDVLTTGPSEDRNVLVVGFIEALQGHLGWAERDPTPIYESLGPTSRSEWDDLLRLWEGVRRRQAASLEPVPHADDPKLQKIIQDIYRPPLRGPAWKPKGTAADEPDSQLSSAQRVLAWAKRLGARLKK
jgi:hypothetical protein